MAITDVQRVRILIGDTLQDTNGDPIGTFSDNDIQVFLDVSGGSLFLAAALALDSLAARAEATPHQVTIGRFQYSAGRTQIRQLTAQAEAFRKLEYDTPACAIIEDNNSDFAALEMVRNQILRGIA